MNYEHIDIDRMVMESHYLHALDIEDSQREGSLSDMERQEYIGIIKTLREERVQLREMISSLQDTIKSLNQQMARRDEIDAAKDKRIAEQNEKIDKLTIALTSTTERLNVMLDEKYNKKSKSNRHDNNKPAKKSREQEKEEDDGTNINSGSAASIPTSEESLDKTKVSSENLDGKRGPRGKYTTMDAAKVVEHKTTKMPIVPPGWVFVDYKFVDEYTSTAISSVIVSRWQYMRTSLEYGTTSSIRWQIGSLNRLDDCIWLKRNAFLKVFQQKKPSIDATGERLQESWNQLNRSRKNCFQGSVYIIVRRCVEP